MIHLEQNVCDKTILPHLMQHKRYRFAAFFAQHKIYRFIWRKWDKKFQVAKYTFFIPFLRPLNWPFGRNFWTRRCSFPLRLRICKKSLLRNWCELYRFIWFLTIHLISLEYDLWVVLSTILNCVSFGPCLKKVCSFSCSDLFYYLLFSSFYLFSGKKQQIG